MTLTLLTISSVELHLHLQGRKRKMLKAGVFEPSVSEWSASPVLVRNRDSSLMCVYYRALNNVTKKDVFPLPIVEECIDTLSDNLRFSKLDATWARDIGKKKKKKRINVTLLFFFFMDYISLKGCGLA